MEKQNLNRLWRSTENHSFLARQRRGSSLVSFGSSSLKEKFGSSVRIKKRRTKTKDKPGYVSRLKKSKKTRGSNFGKGKSGGSRFVKSGSFALAANRGLQSEVEVDDIAKNFATRFERPARFVTKKASVSPFRGGSRLLKTAGKASRIVARRSEVFARRLGVKASVKGASASIKAAALAARAISFAIALVVKAIVVLAAVLPSLPFILLALLVVMLFLFMVSLFFPASGVSATAQMCTQALANGNSFAVAAAQAAPVDNPAADSFEMLTGEKLFDNSFDASFLMPVVGAVKSSDFNLARRNPVTGLVQPHEGVDLAAPLGTPVYASAAGSVSRAGPYSTCGLAVDISHPQYAGKTYLTRYCHLSAISSFVGQKVVAGQEIGRLGSTGRSTGPHLHFEIRINGVAINPWPVISGNAPASVFPSATTSLCEDFIKGKG